MRAGGRRVGEGAPEALGVTPEGDGVNVAVFSAHAERIDFCLFDAAGEREVERVALPERTGAVFHARVGDVPPGTRYGLRAHGPYAPREGHRFNPSRLLVDPYALALDRPFVYDPALRGFDPGAPDRPAGTDTAALVPKAVVTAPPAPAEPWRGGEPWSRTVISELHVRGFTMRHPGVPEPLRGTFAALGTPAVLDHLAALGVTAVELMPAAAWVDERHLPPLGLTNYWGYNPVAYLAPDPRLAPGGWAEVRAATRALNGRGIAVLLDVVYNHTGESDELGPTLSLRGLDNASYYRLLPDDPSRYVNDAGCGNILACDRGVVVRLVLDSLRAWVSHGGINGFRFDLAPTLGRRMSGFEREGPLLAAIEQDPLLRDLKLIAEPWDIGPGGYQLGQFNPRWGEWNDRYRDAVRRFWGGSGTPAELAGRVSGSADLFGWKRRPSRSVNFASAHDGFTLADLVAYTAKRNGANGENNRDGTDDNHSWNNGVEGETADPAVLAARLRDQKTLLATLLLSRGTPMLGPSTERGLTQGGNNNAYAQDNASTWTDWEGEVDLTGFIRRLIDFRLSAPALTDDHFLTGAPLDGDGVADVAWRLPDGRAPTPSDWDHPATGTLVAVLGARRDGAVSRVLVAFHAGSEPVDLVLPPARAGLCWRVAVDTARDDGAAERRMPGGATMVLAARSVVAAVEEPETVHTPQDDDASGDLLGRLAEAAGVAPDWFEMNGTRHAVADATKIAILNAMGFATGSAGELRDGLERLAARRDHRPLPETALAWEGEAPVLRVAGPPSPSLALTVAREDGTLDPVRLDLSDAPREQAVAVDGQPVERVQVRLPVLPVGRHRVWLDGRPDTACALTVAPRRCYLPPEIRAGRKAFGVAAQLYTLRSAGDQGIGDFSTLARLAEEAGGRGAQIVGLNPLHTLSAEHRDQVSPYYPTARRFLEPLYIDVTHPSVTGESAEVEQLLRARAPEIAELRALDAVDYGRVWALKRPILEASFAAFDDRRTRLPDDPDVVDFDRFVTEGAGPLADFALFSAVSDERGGDVWWTWPEALRRPDGPGAATYRDAHRARVDFQLYLQWLADRQLAGAAGAGKDAGLAFGFYRDLAVGTSHGGAEAWANQGVYAGGISVGAPPDAFSADGQTWGLPPPNPTAPGRAWLDTFAGLLAANMRHAGALRIDHAMGLSRLFWIPEGMPGGAGAYVHYPFEQMIGELALESQRARCLVIGEDLGTVAPGFRERLAEADVLSYRVLFFERDDALGFKPAADYPEKAVACVATHDLPTFSGWWRGAEIAERRALGSFTEAEADRASRDRAVERRKLAEAIGRPDLADEAEATSDLVGTVHRFAASAPSVLVMAQADDLAGEATAINLPGTGAERPNWRRRLKPDVDALFDTPLARAALPVREPGA